MARLRLIRVPQLLVAASVLSTLPWSCVYGESMNHAIDVVLVLLVLTNLRLLGIQPPDGLHPTVAAQGVLLGIFPLLVQAGRPVGPPGLSVAGQHGAQGRGLAVAAAPGGPRGQRPQRDRADRRLHNVALLGLGLLGLALRLAGRLPLPGEGLRSSRAGGPVHDDGRAVRDRRRNKAAMQVLGYLAMENGIYAFGMAFAVEEPLLVELGVLLDVFVAVFVMGITIYHISREFDHIDTDQLSDLEGLAA